jgi:hypothetical protein
VRLTARNRLTARCKVPAPLQDTRKALWRVILRVSLIAEHMEREMGRFSMPSAGDHARQHRGWPLGAHSRTPVLSDGSYEQTELLTPSHRGRLAGGVRAGLAACRRLARPGHGGQLLRALGGPRLHSSQASNVAGKGQRVEKNVFSPHVSSHRVRVRTSSGSALGAVCVMLLDVARLPHALIEAKGNNAYVVLACRESSAQRLEPGTSAAQYAGRAMRPETSGLPLWSRSGSAGVKGLSTTHPPDSGSAVNELYRRRQR